MDLQKIQKFHTHFSLLTVGEDKIPNFSWKDGQNKRVNIDTFLWRLKYKSGEFKKDKTEIVATTNFGIITGFEDLECIDVDLKVFSTAKEQTTFWNEYLGYLQDNILDFDEKFVICKTKNAGYHIIYKTKRVEGNLKIAVLEGHKEAVIETRGRGGYIFAYPENVISKKSYFEVNYISDEDRFVLMSFSKMYNFVTEIPIEPKRERKEYADGEITPWQDYNDKTDILDLISSEFTIVGNHSKSYIIKRVGATSPHSGYVFKNSGCMFLFSTGTIYPHEKLITPFIAYTIKNHNGDFKESTKKLYEDGFGTRRKAVIKELKSKIEPREELKINQSDLTFPIDIFPTDIQNYMLQCSTKLDSSIDYMGCSMLWLISVCVGNSINVEVKRGWIENLTVWIAIVGKAGLGKTPSIDNIVKPLTKINSKQIKDYIKAKEKNDWYAALSTKDKKDYDEPEKAKKSQFIANDITLEALVDLHQESDNSVGVFKDELAGWLKDMNKYREGSDLEFWLSTWSGKSVNLNRLTRAGSFVEKPFIPVLGGIQPSVLNGFYTEANKDNGFMDRMLLSFPELKVDLYNENEIDEHILKWYHEIIISFFETIKKVVDRDSDGDIIPRTAKFNSEAKIEWIRIFNEITTVQNDENENEYLKSMLPKQKSYIPRFACLLSVFNNFFDSSADVTVISKKSILDAEKLSKYFVATAKKIKFNSLEVAEIKTTILAKKGQNNFDIFKSIYEKNPNFNKSETAELLGVSRKTIYKYMEKCIQSVT